MLHGPHSPENRGAEPSAFSQGTRRGERPETCLLSGHVYGKTWGALGDVDHQRAFHAGDVLFGGYRVGNEGLKGRQVARHAFEDEIDFARQHVALAHLRPAPRAFLEVPEIAILLAGQADKDETGDFETQRLAVEIGVIPLDETRFL